MYLSPKEKESLMESFHEGQLVFVIVSNNVLRPSIRIFADGNKASKVFDNMNENYDLLSVRVER